MKKILLIIILLILILLLSACPNGKISDKAIEDQEYNTNLFIKISDEYCGRILVDKKTRVMYWESDGTYNGGTLTLIVDKYGNPRIWEG